MSSAGFTGRRVISFESRRAAEMASLIERHGGVAIKAPTLREVPIAQNEHALDFARRLTGGGFDLVVLMTGVGTRALAAEAAPAFEPAVSDGGGDGGGDGAEAVQPGEPGAHAIARFTAALAAVQVVARGPKPAAVLRELGVTGFTTVPEPNTWREVLAVLSSLGELRGRRVAVQEHGAPSHELYAALEAAGAVVTPVPVYRWALPEDTGPLRRALHTIVEGDAAIALFTSRAQVEHAFLIAAEESLADRLRVRLAAGVVASIGPVCSEALRAEGVEPDFEPEHPKMGHLVKEAAARAEEILARKGSRSDQTPAA
jgi:uroporphyrinogen-III synthase